MKVFVFDLLQYGENLEHLKVENELPYPLPGRELSGVHFAMEFLPQQNKVVAGDKITNQIMATGKHVVVIGGGDTGSDCVGTSNRHGAKSITQFELLGKPDDPLRNPVWPYWPTRLRTSSSHEEGAARDWSVATKSFVGENGKVKALKAVRLKWEGGKMAEVPGSEFEMPADLVLLAMGFLGPTQKGLLEQLGVDVAARHAHADGGNGEPRDRAPARGRLRETQWGAAAAN